MALQYRSPDEIVVMKRNVDTNDRIDLVQVAKFDKYPNTFDRKILFSPSRYDDAVVFATDAAVYVASIKCNCTPLPVSNNSLPLCKECTALPVAYNSLPLCIECNRTTHPPVAYNSLPLCRECNRTILPVAYNNRNNSNPLCILPDEKAWFVTNKNNRSALIMSIPRVYRDFAKQNRQGAIAI